MHILPQTIFFIEIYILYYQNINFDMDSTYDALFSPHALFSLFLYYMGKWHYHTTYNNFQWGRVTRLPYFGMSAQSTVFVI